MFLRFVLLFPLVQVLHVVLLELSEVNLFIVAQIAFIELVGVNLRYDLLIRLHVAWDPRLLAGDHVKIILHSEQLFVLFWRIWIHSFILIL